MNVILLLLLAGLTHATRSFSADGEPGSSGTSLALGYLLISGYFAGAVLGRLGLPKLTGYLVVGALVGPSGFGLVSRPMVESLSLVNGMAISMIALTAGTELDLARLRPYARTLAGITVFGVLGTVVLLAVTLWFARPLLPFFADMSSTQAMSVTLLLAVVLVAQSPSVVVALRDELRADGPVTRTVLALVVLGDLLVIMLFAPISAIARTTFGGSAEILPTLATLSWEIGGSLFVGAIAGSLLVLYLRKIRTDAALLLLAVAFVVAEVGSRLGLDPLLVALAAGALVRNTSQVADELHDQLQVSALPVYVLFFCLAGATLRPDTLAVIWLPTALLAAVRAIGFLLGARLGAHLTGAPVMVRRFAGFGLLPQAGLAQALAILFSRTFPEFADQAGALVLSVVAVNVVLSPVAYRFALVRAGEVGKETGRTSWETVEVREA
ncbi:MAG TPA: cation:proton antiporter [Polyangiales bacterium]|nr:cation:proton antiporter [Polyangiales bacterium]